MIEKVMDIVRQSSRLMEDSSFDVQSKGTASNFVTSADLAVESFLRERLPPLVKNSVFVGEESDTKDFESQYQWIVDPIDGTANFIRDIGYSAISAGLVKDGESILGVVYNPYRDEMFCAEKGRGAFLNGRKIEVSRRDLRHSIFCTAMSLYNKQLAKPCINILEKVYGQCDDMRRMGSAALELVYLACGRIDLYFEIRVFPWDYTAAEVIIREAGGFTGTIGFDRMVFNRPIPMICANSRENFEYLNAVIKEEIPQIPYED